MAEAQNVVLTSDELRIITSALYEYSAQIEYLIQNTDVSQEEKDRWRLEEDQADALYDRLESLRK